MARSTERGKEAESDHVIATKPSSRILETGRTQPMTAERAKNLLISLRSRSPHPPPVLPLVLHHTTPHARRPGHRSSLVPITALHQSPRRPEQTPTCQRLPPSPPSPPHLHLPFQPPSNRQPWPSSAMAKRTSTSSSSSSNWTAMKASCYTVNAASMALQGFHYSTTPAAGVEWRS